MYSHMLTFIYANFRSTTVILCLATIPMMNVHLLKENIMYMYIVCEAGGFPYAILSSELNIYNTSSKM